MQNTQGRTSYNIPTLPLKGKLKVFLENRTFKISKHLNNNYVQTFIATEVLIIGIAITLLNAKIKLYNSLASSPTVETLTKYRQFSTERGIAISLISNEAKIAKPNYITEVNNK
jgi:hypothetical protein